VNRSFSYPNARGTVSRFDSLLMEFNHLLVSVQLLRSPPDFRSFDAGRASRTPFFFQHGFRLFWLLLGHCLYAAQHAVFRQGLERASVCTRICQVLCSMPHIGNLKRLLSAFGNGRCVFR
jgi:hypothetical protein